MLKQLKIDQFVIIEKMDQDFRRGLTILTGETGAGKSIILGAMGLILGEESNSKSIRQGHEQSVIEGHMEPGNGHPSLTFLQEKGIVDASTQEIVINRVVKKEADDDIKINGKPVDRELLEELGTHLIEIHGQFANQSLLGPANQLNILDAYGNFEPEIFANVKDALDDVHKFTKALEEEKTFLAKNKGRVHRKIQEIVKKFEGIDMKEGFQKEAEEKYDELVRAKETSEAFQSMMGRLIATNGAIVSIGGAKETLDRQENVDREEVQELDNHLTQALKHTREAVEQMNTIIPKYEIDWEPLTYFKKVVDTMHEIARENKIEYADVEDFWATMDKRLKRIENGTVKLKEIEDDLIQAKNRYRKHAQILTEKRMEAGKRLGQAITSELPPLKLNKAEFDVQVEEKQDMEWTEKGFNIVTFIARMNPGMPFSPIAETASGGELARMILALKVVLQEIQTTSTLVFDEVDTGIGGAAAAAVGDRISMLAEKSQVVVITHSPQVASRGDQHYHISKRVEGDVTISSVNELSQEERTNEISRMLAGGELTDESYAAAERLIREASDNVAARQQAAPPPTEQQVPAE
ncbi:MAG: AAA family ATPase [Pseudomonadota bacterium]